MTDGGWRVGRVANGRVADGRILFHNLDFVKFII